MLSGVVRSQSRSGACVTPVSWRQRSHHQAVTIYTQQQAATVCGVSVRTLQRRIPALESAGAWKDATGQWHITLDALREAGFTPGRPSAPDPASRPGHVSRTRQSDTAAADARVAELEREMTEWRRYVEMDIAEWRRRAELAEALAAERARTIDAQALALRALTAHHTDPTPAPAPAPPHRTLWTRLRHRHPLPA